MLAFLLELIVNNSNKLLYSNKMQAFCDVFKRIYLHLLYILKTNS